MHLVLWAHIHTTQQDCRKEGPSAASGDEHLPYASGIALALRLPLTRAVEPVSQILSGFSVSQSSSLECSSGTPLPLRPQ